MDLKQMYLIMGSQIRYLLLTRYNINTLNSRSILIFYVTLEVYTIRSCFISILKYKLRIFFYDRLENDLSISLNWRGYFLCTSPITRLIWRLVQIVHGVGQCPFSTSGANRLIIFPVSSHGPFSSTQSNCCLMYFSSLNFRLTAISDPKHATSLIPGRRSPGLLGRLRGIGRAREGLSGTGFDSG